MAAFFVLNGQIAFDQGGPQRPAHTIARIDYNEPDDLDP